jgi:hypothetical protein
MKYLKTQQELNEASENLNISDVMNSKKTIRVVNPKYTIDVFRDKKTGTMYYSNSDNPDYYITNTTISGIYILDIINNYKNLIPIEVNGNKVIPDDLFVFYYS